MNGASAALPRGHANLLGSLSTFRAFTDPVHKLLFVLGLNSATCNWVYQDSELLDPPVDYHEVRGHLRLGTVELLDESLRTSILNGDYVDEAADVAIRTAVTNAIRLVGEYSRYSPMQLHYAFWNLFRGICLKSALVPWEPARSPAFILPASRDERLLFRNCAIQLV